MSRRLLFLVSIALTLMSLALAEPVGAASIGRQAADSTTLDVSWPAS